MHFIVFPIAINYPSLYIKPQVKVINATYEEVLKY